MITAPVVERYRMVWATVFAGHRYRILALLLFVAFALFYLVTLPATFTGGRIGWVSLRFLTPTLAAFAVALAAAAALTFTLAVYGFRTAAATGARGTGLLGGVVAILPSMLCCTPVIPTLLALLGASTPTLFTLSGRIQGFFATWEIPILTFALLLLLGALHRTVLRLSGSCARRPAVRARAPHGV